MPTDILIDGNKLILNGITGNLGDAQGVAAFDVAINAPDMAAAVTIARTPFRVLDALGIASAGLSCTNRPFSEDPDGEYTIRFSFEGFLDEARQFDPAEDDITYAFTPTENESPIQTHPLFTELQAEYGWDPTNERFPETYSPSNLGLPVIGALGPLSQFAAAEEASPLKGVESWLQFGGEFTRSYAVRFVPARIYRGIGTLIERPPDIAKLGIPNLPDRYWLKMAPDVERGPSGVGKAIRVIERYRLTGISSGSEKILYKFPQLA